MKHLPVLACSLFLMNGNAQSWQQLGAQGVGGVADIVEYDGELYITGDFEEIGGVTVNNIARWDGAAWAPVGTGLTSWGYGSCMAVYNGELYVAGYFDTAGGVNTYRLARWNGSTWSNVQNGLDMLLLANDMLVIGNVLYIGGSPDAACNTPLVNMVQWNGTAFSTLGTGELEYQASTILKGTVYALAEHQGALYVAGLFDDVDGLACEGLLRWEGGAWHAGPPGLPMSFNIDVAFIGGALTCAQNSDQVMQWNGSVWTDFTSGWPGTGSTSAMIEYNGVPVIAGHYNAGPYALNPNWGLVGAIAGSPGISELRIIGNDLFAVGDQGVVVNGFVERRTLVVKWSGPLDVREQAMLPVGIHPNPATDRLYLDLAPDASRNIRILDMTGRTVQGWVMDRDGQVDVSALPAGMYALQVRDVDRMGGGRFVKE
ncbi:MAG: T9SS type A sorting domain-containing protein [Flavobacteriales bacterium]|nr:T9SS type A sorting domain-containing protein [Flavobacteriales bacterium]MCB9168401.1 T9SS type A sorting domain-containing protein [Flavobacteriales bacterium]